MSRYWSPVVHALDPYVPGEQPKLDNLLKLNTNENPYPPSPKAIAAMQAELGDGLRLYPDPNAEQLKHRIANYYGLSVAQVFVGNGSDEVLAHVFAALLKHEQAILFPDITYSFYPVYCGLYQVSYQAIPLNEKFQMDVQDYKKSNGGIIFPNPNAPTGVALSLAAIETLLDNNPDSVVVVDEAYVDFGADSAVSLIDRYPQLLVVQTLSKSRSLAGLRVGFAMGHAELIDALERVKNSFNSYPLGRMAIAGAAAAIDDHAYFQRTCQKIIEGRQWLCAELEKVGFQVLPSSANFIFARHPQRDGKILAQSLREQAVLVRHFDKPRISDFLRITIGTPEQNQRLLQSIQKIF